MPILRPGGWGFREGLPTLSCNGAGALMYPVRRISSCLLAALVMAAVASPVNAVILSRTATRNTAAPSGTLLNSGWQWEGNFGGFLGTPIAPNYFITAEHIGGSVGQTLTLNGKTYKTTAKFDDAATDLRIWKVSTAFSSYAPMYVSSYETGKSAVDIGRG